MKKIFQTIIGNRIILSIIGLVALSILVWFGGPAIKFGESNTAPLASPVVRLVIIMIILLAWGLNNLRVQMQNRKQNQQLVEDLQENQKQAETGGASGQTREELAQINQRFDEALATLKRVKFKGAGTTKALYQLPWYIIIGPPGAGKTVALINSGLEFPLAGQFGAGEVKGVGGTRNCDWFFTNEAVLIDTAGRYTTQDSHRVVDSSAWEGFLGLLRTNRPRRPINGAIVAISLQDLLTQTEEERAQHARVIRSRIDELMEKLQIRFPIYLLFTKCDLVSGFSEFFEDLGKEDRDQVWGVSLPNAPKPGDSPDFDFLQAEYEALLARLYDRVLWRMHHERDMKRRGAIESFPQQIENLKTIINTFVRQTFARNRYQFQPYLRGFYFSSATQDGTPIDRLMTSVAANFGFDRSVAQLPQQRGKSFFLTKLFREVIFPESELVGTNMRYENIVRWAQIGSLAGMAALAVLMIVVWTGSVTRHEIYMARVQGFIKDYTAENARVGNWNSDFRAVLPALGALAKASAVYDQEQHPWLSGMGLYDPNVDHAADAAYGAKLRELLQPRLLAYLESYLRQGHSASDQYSSFRTYMMFRKLDHLDKPQVQDWFQTNWLRQLQGEASNREELKRHVQALLDSDLKPAELNSTLVSDTRSQLLRVPVSQRVYSRIRSNPKYTQEIEIANLLGDSVRVAHNINPATERALAVPLLFTKEAYASIDFSPDSPVMSDVLNERWVFSDDRDGRMDYGKEDLKDIGRQAKEHYLTEYLDVWTRALTSLKVAEFRDLSHANDILSRYSDPVQSPLVAILRLARDHTELTPPLLANYAEDRGDTKSGKLAGLLADKIDTTVVDKRFRELHVLVREGKDRPAPVTAIMQQVKQLRDFMYEISAAPDPAKKSFEIASARYQSGSGNAITNLVSYAKTTPQPVADWLNGLATQSWKVVLGNARQHVDAEWRNQVYKPYQQGLAGRYPLSRGAGDELASLDFAEFFKPGGTLDKFVGEYMKPFIDTRGSWNNRIIDEYGIGFNGDALVQLQNAALVRDVFFRENPASPGLTFELRPYFMNKSDARFTLEIGEKRVTYNHGPKFWSPLSWSAGDDRSRIRVVFEGLDGEQAYKTYEGPWSWFKLLGDSKIQSAGGTSIYLVTFRVADTGAGGGRGNTHSVTYEIRAKSAKNPFGADTMGSLRLPGSV
jgi:type VI secretion system protein ImpL